MSSVVRATPAQQGRRIIVLATALLAVLVGQGQAALGWGQSPAEFAADSDATLKVAGWAFAVWGVIYLGMLAYAARQVLPQTGESELLQSLGWPSAAAFLGIGVWVVAAALDAEAATIVLIFASLLVLLVSLLLNGGRIRSLGPRERDRWLTVWPLSLLAGWLTIAAPVNLLTVLTGDGALPTMLPPTAWAIFALLFVAAVALAVTARLRVIAYALPIAWGLLGVFVAEQPRNGVLAWTAILLSAAVLVGAVILSLGLRRSREVEA